MRTLCLLVLGCGLFSQEAARLETVAGVAPEYEGRAAVDTFLHGPGRVLAAGAEGFYLMEPGGRILRVDGGGTIQPFPVSSRDRTMDADDAGNLCVFVFPGEVRRYTKDGEGSTLYDFRNGGPIGDSFSVTAFAVSRDGGDHYFSNAFGLWRLPALGLLGGTEARRARRMWHDGKDVVFLSTGGAQVYRTRLFGHTFVHAAIA